MVARKYILLTRGANEKHVNLHKGNLPEQTNPLQIQEQKPNKGSTQSYFSDTEK